MSKTMLSAAEVKHILFVYSKLFYIVVGNSGKWMSRENILYIGDLVYKELGE